MMLRRLTGVLSLLLMVGLVGCLPQAPAKTRLIVAIQPTLSAAEIVEKARPLEQYLEQRLGDADVEVYVPLTQAGVIEALRFGQAHVAFMGPFPAHLAVERADAELVLAEVREVIHGQQKVEAPYYYSYWVARPESPYARLSDLRGQRACFPSPVSSSGYIAPMAKLIELVLLSQPAQGEVDPKAFFGEVLFGGGYGQCWQALKAGQVDVTVIAGDVPEGLYREVLAGSRVLEEQGPLPSHAVIVSKSLKEPLRSRVIEALLGLNAPEYRPLMRQFISGLFVGFQRSDAATHLGSFQRFVKLTRVAFTERVNP